MRTAHRAGARLASVDYFMILLLYSGRRCAPLPYIDTYVAFYFEYHTLYWTFFFRKFTYNHCSSVVERLFVVCIGINSIVSNDDDWRHWVLIPQYNRVGLSLSHLRRASRKSYNNLSSTIAIQLSHESSKAIMKSVRTLFFVYRTYTRRSRGAFSLFFSFGRRLRSTIGGEREREEIIVPSSRQWENRECWMKISLARERERKEDEGNWWENWRLSELQV